MAEIFPLVLRTETTGPIEGLSPHRTGVRRPRHLHPRRLHVLPHADGPPAARSKPSATATTPWPAKTSTSIRSYGALSVPGRISRVSAVATATTGTARTCKIRACRAGIQHAALIRGCSTRADGADTAAKMRALRTLGVPYTDADIDGAAAAVAGTTEADALIAYLQEPRPQHAQLRGRIAMSASSVSQLVGEPSRFASSSWCGSTGRRNKARFERLGRIPFGRRLGAGSPARARRLARHEQRLELCSSCWRTVGTLIAWSLCAPVRNRTRRKPSGADHRPRRTTGSRNTTTRCRCGGCGCSC